MPDNDLTPDDAAVLRYLSQRVDNLHHAWWRGGQPRISNELKVAIHDLRQFKSKLRQQARISNELKVAIHDLREFKSKLRQQGVNI